MHARGLQHSQSTDDGQSSGFDSCMREDCNCGRVYRPRQVCIILIHACARIATYKSLKEQTEYDILIHACARIATAFDCCQRGIFVILIHACARIATRGLLGRGHPGDFDSCMREDCNKRSNVAQTSTAVILIHACARIATWRCFEI